MPDNDLRPKNEEVFLTVSAGSSLSGEVEDILDEPVLIAAACDLVFNIW